MKVRTHVEFTPDPGRQLTRDEIDQVAHTVTVPVKIKRKVCLRETNNDKYRLGRR